MRSDEHHTRQQARLAVPREVGRGGICPVLLHQFVIQIRAWKSAGTGYWFPDAWNKAGVTRRKSRVLAPARFVRDWMAHDDKFVRQVGEISHAWHEEDLELSFCALSAPRLAKASAYRPLVSLAVEVSFADTEVSGRSPDEVLNPTLVLGCVSSSSQGEADARQRSLQCRRKVMKDSETTRLWCTGLGPFALLVAAAASRSGPWGRVLSLR